MINNLRTRYKSIDDAEKAFDIGLDSYQGYKGNSFANKPSTSKQNVTDNHVLLEYLKALTVLSDELVKDLLSITLAKLKRKQCLEIIASVIDKSVSVENLSSLIQICFDHIEDLGERKNVLNNMYLQVANKMGIDTNPADYASMSLAAMVELQNNKKPNLVYKWSQCLTRKSEGKPALKMNRMPFGLIQYQIEFFSCTNSTQVSETDDFRTWIDTMESEFGGRFIKLFRGPMWSGMERNYHKDPTKV